MATRRRFTRELRHEAVRLVTQRGVLAFRLKRPRWLRIMLFFTAVLLFAFIISTALLHDPEGVFSLMEN